MDSVDNFYHIKNQLKTNFNNVKIIAVTKSFNLEKINPLLKIGHLDFGENRVQEAISKWSPILKTNSDINLHLLGHLQSNKVSEAVSLFNFVHSLDSEKLAIKFKEAESNKNRKLKYFIQVNIGEESQKHGIPILEVANFLNFCRNEAHLNIIGLMCIPPISASSSNYFSQLKELSILNKLSELSMGMSNDYMEAVKCGATFIRVGSAIFGKRI
jgi:pyridoxal phosphate enzyme (YggS family)